MCKECEKRVKNWNGDDPTCAFGTGYFQYDNFECETINKLRNIIDNLGNSYNDNNENLGVIPYNGMFIVLTWYKNRGGVETLTIFNRNREYSSMTDLAICEEIIKEMTL